MWLIAGGGTLYFAFPLLYASGFSGWYTLSGGATALAALAMHGATYIALKSEGDLNARARRLALRIWPPLLVLTTLSLVATPAAPEGHLVLAGGGRTPPAVFTRTLELSGGRKAIVAVLPQTYPNDSIGDVAVAIWKQLGAHEVLRVSLADPAAASAALERATLIWMPGGFQGLLMHALAGTPIPDLIRKRFAEGATIGGASAGAAAMSRTMIADETTPDGAGVDGRATADGLGLWPEAIVSPHFAERHRMNPLMAIVRHHPDLIGVGIDEGTAAVVSRGELQVMGRGTVVIVDLREVGTGHSGSDPTSSARRPAVRVLKPGMRFRFALAYP